MNNSKITASQWKDAIISGANNLINNKNKIDSLNVFPVPDGDTGTNMSSTIEEAKKDLQKTEFINLYDVANVTDRSMLMGARGNSGVILSQIFKGFSNAFQGKKEIDVNELLIGFEEATKKAYASVLKPVEGTILTVIRETYEALKTLNISKLSPAQFMNEAVVFTRIACNNTPNKLKVLREVGVNDSGGEGLFLIIEGIAKSLNNEPVELLDKEGEINSFISNTEIYEGEFGYCTEFILTLNEPENFKKDELIKVISNLANSLVVINDVELLKVHGHTLFPGKLLNIAQKYGEFRKIKIDNMSLQANETKNNIKSVNNEDEAPDKCAVISCNLGQGIIEQVKQNGCDNIIESGQTQNPSSAQIIEAINKCNAETVFILPNNSNIILTAQQAAQTIMDKKIIIIPTKTQIQGLSALLYFNKDASAAENKELMSEAYQNVKSGQVTTAVRTTTIEGIKIVEGSFLSILNNKIIACSKTYIDAAKKVLEASINKDSEIVTLFYGDNASENDAEELAEFIKNNYEVEVEIYNGTQPNYHFLIGVE
ncbi:DAK2 domain-containing protein [Mycoplasma phocimorsus]|uniref:DAK2 domain-containing protein n=1 Tax=Mycoplasma phocimorsus TaxID=3045839 RepID=UPI0024C08894|nr:DAK2 domain-containing protein [Mycoplasma phocimorsus]MDJ1649051.1 DAK2 domain-containing protein [Mycoplasma phocimorsus]